jgi:hypothetical protein
LRLVADLRNEIVGFIDVPHPYLPKMTGHHNLRLVQGVSFRTASPHDDHDDLTQDDSSADALSHPVRGWKAVLLDVPLEIKHRSAFQSCMIDGALDQVR